MNKQNKLIKANKPKPSNRAVANMPRYTRPRYARPRSYMPSRFVTHTGYNNGLLFTSKPLKVTPKGASGFRSVLVEGNDILYWKNIGIDDHVFVLTDSSGTAVSEGGVFRKDLTINDGDTSIELRTLATMYSEWKLDYASIELIPLLSVTSNVTKPICFIKYAYKGETIPSTTVEKSAWIQNQTPITMINHDTHRIIKIAMPKGTQQFGTTNNINLWQSTSDLSDRISQEVGYLYFQTDTSMHDLDDKLADVLICPAYRLQCKFRILFRKEKLTNLPLAQDHIIPANYYADVVKKAEKKDDEKA